METIPSYNKRITASGGGAVCGKKLYSYCLRTDGVNDATLTLKETNTNGSEIWKDVCLGADLAKPVSPRKPIGVHQDQLLWAEVTGTGAEVDICYEY